VFYEQESFVVIIQLQQPNKCMFEGIKLIRRKTW